MSSLRNHRIVIASLFLPNTAILGESEPSTPDDRVTALPEFKLVLPSGRQPNKPLALTSIVEDLKNKVRVTVSASVPVPAAQSAFRLWFFSAV